MIHASARRPSGAGIELLARSLPALGCDSCPKTPFSPRRLGAQEPVNRCEAYRGKVILIVNTASRCAFTPRYADLEANYRRSRDRGLTVLGFPSNDFGGREAGVEGEIKRPGRLSYGVQFLMFEKTHAAQGNAEPIYRVLAEKAGADTQCNFRKYLLDRAGNLVASLPSQTIPEDARILAPIERGL